MTTSHPSSDVRRDGVPEQPASAELSARRAALGRTAAFGLLLFVVSLAGFAPEQSPDAGTATAEEIRRFAADNATTLQLNMVANLASVLLLLLFTTALAGSARLVAPRSLAPSLLASLAAVVSAMMLIQAAAASVFARPDALNSVSDAAVVTFYQFETLAEWLYSLTVLVPGAALIGTFSWLAHRRRLIARWVAAFGLLVTFTAVVTTVLLVLPTAEVDTLIVPLFGWWLWPLLVGLAAAVRWWRSRTHQTDTLTVNE